jgi:sulfate adenylyltransferase
MVMTSKERATDLRGQSKDWRSWDLTPRQLCDLELILNGACAPLAGFQNRADYTRVCAEMRLADGALWPMPLTLDVSEAFARATAPGATVALRDPEGVMLAALHVEDVWQPDREAEALAVLGSNDQAHSGVRYLMNESGPWYVGGRLEGLQLPSHVDYRDLRLTPADTRAAFAARGWTRVVALQTRNPMHRAHVELTLRAAREADAYLLVHPAIGMTAPGDVDHHTRVRCYRAAMAAYPEGLAMLALLPIAMRMGGPREALWHALVRKNFGCTHFIVGRDHASPGGDAEGQPFYGPYEAQALVAEHQKEAGIEMVPFREMVYLAEADHFVPENEVSEGRKTRKLSGTELRTLLSKGQEIPAWFSTPDVIGELRRSYPPRSCQGCTIFFTGLSGSGKSTIAQLLQIKLLELGGRQVTMLDGDQVRKHLSSELGFSKVHRDLNVRRIGYVAAEVTKHGGFAICAPIAPYEGTRQSVRRLVEAHGGFVLVHVSTPIEVCEARDRKGLYAKARAGLIPEFTGVSDPYETPVGAEVTVDASLVTAEIAVGMIVNYLGSQGFLADITGREATS